jgi:hypothetical protein
MGTFGGCTPWGRYSRPFGQHKASLQQVQVTLDGEDTQEQLGGDRLMGEDHCCQARHLERATAQLLEEGGSHSVAALAGVRGLLAQRGEEPAAAATGGDGGGRPNGG